VQAGEVTIIGSGTAGSTLPEKGVSSFYWYIILVVKDSGCYSLEEKVSLLFFEF